MTIAELKAAEEKIETLLRDEKNQDKIKSLTDIEDIMGFFEENGVSYTDELKDEIRKATADLSAEVGDGELTEDALASVAGGWSWDSFFGGASGGAIVGGIIGAIAASTNPVGWVIAAGAGVGALVGAGSLGSLIGAIGD